MNMCRFSPKLKPALFISSHKMENFSSSAPAEFHDAMEEAFEDTNENINAVNESDPPP